MSFFAKAYVTSEVKRRKTGDQDAGKNASVVQQTMDAAPVAKKKKSSSTSTQALAGVVFVLSGFQNPEREQVFPLSLNLTVRTQDYVCQIRNKAINLGAKYSQNWDRTCTHLVSAFENTPKVKEVKGMIPALFSSSLRITPAFLYTAGRQGLHCQKRLA